MPVVDECHDLVVNAILWTGLALAAVGLRLFTRGFIVKRTGWDDYLMGAAMVSCSTVSSFTVPSGLPGSLSSYPTHVGVEHCDHDNSYDISWSKVSGRLDADRVTRFAQ
jgi:hypothetical protein